MSQSLKDVASPTQSDCVPRILALHARNNPKAIAIEALGRPPLTYGRLQGFLEQFAQHLNSLGIGRHDRVALVMPNGPEMAVAFLTTTACCVLAPLNPAYRAEEFEFYLSDLKVQAVIVPARSHSPVRTVAERLSILVLELSPDLNAEAGLFTVSGSSRGLPRLNGFASPADTALLLHTSGTTSRPKLVPLTHTNICLSAGNVARALQLSAGDRCLNIMPLFHIHGLIGAVLSSMVSGASVVCSPGFVAPQFFDWLEAFHPTLVYCGPDHAPVYSAAGAKKRQVSFGTAPPHPLLFGTTPAPGDGRTGESLPGTSDRVLRDDPAPPNGQQSAAPAGAQAGVSGSRGCLREIAVVDDKGNFLGPGVSAKL